MLRTAVLAALLVLPALVGAADRAALRLSARAEKHIRERHCPGGGQTRGKSVFLSCDDLPGLLGLVAEAAARRQANGRDKRVADAGRPIGRDGRRGRSVASVTVIAEPDGEVVTMYPGR